MISPPRVYVSAPAESNLSSSQRAVKDALMSVLEERGLAPQEFLRSGLVASKPWTFEAARGLVQRCSGAVILAFARWECVGPGGQVTFLPSEYSHFEGGLAVSRGLPLLVVTDQRVRTSGVTLMSEVPLIFWPEDKGEEWATDGAFLARFEGWVASVQARRRVFLGYCSAARSTANELVIFLERELGVSVREYSMDFASAITILENLQDAAGSCDCAIFLLTRDDQLGGDIDEAAPRDNVIFEAGFFTYALGKARVLIIREDGNCLLISGGIYTYV